MALYDSTGREVMAMRWDAIADKPDRINEIAALIDPNALRYVGWNDASNELELLAFAAEDIPYDNTTSGLAASDVQAAIDEISMGTTSAVFAGRVSLLGTTVTSDLPSGWTCNRPALGRYNVTHGLGNPGYEELSVTAMGIHDGVFDTGYPRLVQIQPAGSNGNAFQVGITTDFAGIDFVNTEWFFLAKLNSGA